MGDKLDLPENILRDYIPDIDKVKWILDNNHNITYFTEDDIRRITSNYKTKLGTGAFGEVYEGVLGEDRLVAVKRYIQVNKLDEFAKEVIVHTQVNHKNVVRLIGCCKDKNAPMIVLEYAANGSLNDCLYHADTPISLGTRLSIVIECAEALWCMHSMYNPIIHYDFKLSNILLDENLHAKISDFGISRILLTDNTNLTMNVRGSIGYMDPTFAREGRLTPKSDVYSFGVVLVELITKTKPADMEKDIVRRFVQASAKRKGAQELFDVGIANESNIKILEGIGKIAKDCMEEDIDKRPEMNDVAAHLRELRRTLEQGREKTSWQFFSGGRHDLKKENQQERSNFNSSTVFYKIKNLGIFKWNAIDNFKKNGGLILQNISNIKIFTKEEILNITQNFSTALSKSSSSDIYLGDLDDNTRVAVKIFTDVSGSREEFVGQLTIQSQVQHQNIVKLFGCCLEMDHPISVCEYVPNGPLSNYLVVEKGEETGARARSLLDMNTRHCIALGVANAIACLHEECLDKPFDGITPWEILLDAGFCSKLSKLTPTIIATRTVTTPILDKHKYVAPERFHLSHKPITASAKADVYSFGALLVEIIFGIRDIMFWEELAGSKEPFDFLNIVFPEAHLKQRIVDCLDPHIIQAEADDATRSVATAERMVITAMWCMQFNADRRPTMRKVIDMLEGTIDIAEPPHPIRSYVYDNMPALPCCNSDEDKPFIDSLPYFISDEDEFELL
ncbi:uncharacterized protein LOC127752646 [Oryza glaberrima]|uniref:uncharacterized protein LOC127752646 n=1 Tax=Oryza glaberrima TaxID=4538 RepID=UPI00023DCC82|nr:uncharacterized protein LOC127752646 [Oryza glaberrima]